MNLLTIRNKVLLLVLILFVISCQKDLPTYLDFDDYAFDTQDQGGGSWTPILLSEPEAIAIEAPAPTESSEYQSELEQVKSMQSQLTDRQREVIRYWTNNPGIRWNEITLELIAKYNLIPGPNEDETYTLPNPGSPDGPPPFPFAHPPYACRALAYLSAAQYDGLIAAWHYKFKYGRPAPAELDSEITNHYVDTQLPSYPASGAVVAEVSRRILSAMFPLEKAYLDEKASEHLQSLLWSGTQVQSDIDAGKIIAEYVSDLALTRAAGDGMKNAQTPKPVSDSIKAAAFARFGWQWDNLEIPTRPVGLTPFFSKVKPWFIPSVEEVRPVPPPAPGTEEFEANVAELISYQKNMTEEHRRIANFWQDGLGTYTPPGHWNRIANDYIVRYHLNPLRTARTFAYMNIAIMDGGISCWDAKYYYHYPRPIQTIPGFTTIAGTPNFPSYTSGHSVFSAAAAEVLAYIFPQDATTFRNWALEAAESRIYGGIHYRFDAEVGTSQGIVCASYAISAARNDGADN